MWKYRESETDRRGDPTGLCSELLEFKKVAMNCRAVEQPSPATV